MIRLLLALLAPLPAFAGGVVLRWENAPAAVSYTLRSGCVQSGQYERAPIVGLKLEDWQIDGLPDAAICYFLAVAGTAQSNELAAVIGVNGAQLPARPTAAPAISWQALPAALVSALNRPYAIDKLANGIAVYSDREYTFTSVPAVVNGTTYVRPANDDKTLTTNPLLTFTLGAPATLYVGWDTRSARLPWISSWADAGAALKLTDTTSTLHLYSRAFPAGAVALGPANYASGHGSMYVLMVVP